MYVSFPCNPEPPEIDANPHPSYQNRPVELVLIQCSCPLTAFGSPFLQSVFTYHHGAPGAGRDTNTSGYIQECQFGGGPVVGCMRFGNTWTVAWCREKEVEFWVSHLYIRTY